MRTLAPTVMLAVAMGSPGPSPWPTGPHMRDATQAAPVLGDEVSDGAHIVRVYVNGWPLAPAGVATDGSISTVVLGPVGHVHATLVPGEGLDPPAVHVVVTRPMARDVNGDGVAGDVWDFIAMGWADD